MNQDPHQLPIADLAAQALADLAAKMATKPDPLRDPRVMILELSDDQARPFAGLGEVWAVIGAGSYPGFAGRLCLFVMPCEKSTAAAACGVVTGTHRATRIKTATSQPRSTVTPANTP